MPVHRTDDSDEVESTRINVKTCLMLQSEFAPQERIPPEVLTEVFFFAADNEPVAFPPDFSRPHWVVSRVCRRWRKAALCAPRLWSCIRVLPVRSDSIKSMVALINSTLPPTGPISIDAYGQDGKQLDHCLSSVIAEEVVWPRLPRILELRLNLVDDLLLGAPDPLPLASLEVLDIYLDIDFESSDVRHLIRNTKLLGKAHRLRDLALQARSSNAHFVVPALLDTPIPWHQLVTLSFGPDELKAEEVHYILQQSPSLRTFTAFMCDPIQEESTKNIIHPCLCSLTLWVSRSSILKSLILPALKHLHLNALFTGSCAQVSRMISRSNCSLEVFEGWTYPIGADVTLDVLSSMPTVHKFIANRLRLNDAALGMIGRGELLPRVSELMCAMKSAKAFVDALEMRLEREKTAESSITPLRIAIGQCALDSEKEKAETVARLDALNEKHGRRYSMKWMTYKWH